MNSQNLDLDNKTDTEFCDPFGRKNLSKIYLIFNPSALRTPKTPWSFGYYECNRVKVILKGEIPEIW